MSTDRLAEALDLIEHLNMDPKGRIIPLILADIAQSLRPHTTMFDAQQPPPDNALDYSDEDGTDWPARKGWSPSGNTWLCPEPGCGFGIGGLLDPTAEERDEIGEHIREHEAERVVPSPPAAASSIPTAGPTWECPACHFRGPQALTEPSLVELDRFDELASEVRRWREVDRIFPPEAQEWWDATDRFRDVVDRIGGAL